MVLEDASEPSEFVIYDISGDV